MIEFIVENYELILKLIIIFLEVVAFLVFIFKKKVTQDPFGNILALLPELINRAESLIGAGNGQKKKDFVIDLALKAYKHLTGVELSKDSRYARYLNDAIEDILSAPQKKGK